MIHVGNPDTDHIDGADSGGDQPPAHDAMSLHRPLDLNLNPHTTSSSFLDPVEGSANPDLVHTTKRAHPDVDKSPPSRPSPAFTSPPNEIGASHLEKPRARKNKWLSFLPFTSSRSAKQVRKSVLTIIHDLITPPSHPDACEPPNVHAILASAAKSCTECNISISTILQELSIAEHTPMYWAAVNYREELLVALLKYARPLLGQTISDIRCACLFSSNQELFHALRVRRPPFHGTDGLQLSSVHTTADGLLLGARPADEIHIQPSGEGAFVATFDIALWQRRMQAVGRVSIEFIASGRIWSITFFSTGSPSPVPAHGKSKKEKEGGTWHVMVALLEFSPPTFVDS
ncbi:hypothetical protein BS17DRAFT_481926 [Gyrodon lividus]|nr:hypothetical protein BS17DRAFT_481926 [Gyrodon lividus]